MARAVFDLSIPAFKRSKITHIYMLKATSYELGKVIGCKMLFWVGILSLRKEVRSVTLDNSTAYCILLFYQV
jgi:hypothetical protein